MLSFLFTKIKYRVMEYLHPLECFWISYHIALKYFEQLLKMLRLKRVRYRHICLIDHKSTLGACQEQANYFLHH